MALRLTLGLAALLCLAGMAAAHWPTKPHQTQPTKLERSCWAKTVYVPCFILDEYTGGEARI